MTQIYSKYDDMLIYIISKNVDMMQRHHRWAFRGLRNSYYVNIHVFFLNIRNASPEVSNHISKLCKCFLNEHEQFRCTTFI